MASVERPITQQPSTTGAPGMARPGIKPPRPFFVRSLAALVITAALIAAHVYGWQVAAVDPGKLVEKAPYMQRILSQLLNPDIISHDQQQIVVENSNIAGADKIVENGQPAQITQRVMPVLKTGEDVNEAPPGTQAYNPTFTVSSGTVGPGQTIAVSGSGFRPNAGGTIIWQFPGTNSFPTPIATFVADGAGNFSAQATIPSDPTQVVTLFPNTLRVSQTWDVGSPYLSKTVGVVFNRIIETIFQALMGTTFAIVISIPLSFLAARNLMAHNIIGTTIYAIARTILNVLRSVEVLIWVIIFASAVGIGAFAGVLALTLHSIASLGKLYSEAIESIDPGPIEAITASGANRLQVIMYAVVPQFIPQFISFTLYRWDINVRMSTVIGLVGGGGIGFILIQYINLLQWNQAGTAIIFIAIVVIAMDWASSRIRAAVI